jgi:uncharacterized membrane protein
LSAKKTHVYIDLGGYFPMTDFVYFLGRFHVLVVHLPIGILLLAALLEILVRFRRFRALDAALPTIWLLGGISAVVTIVIGYMHASEGGFDESTLNWHRWTATFTAIVAFSIWAWRVESPRSFAKAWPAAAIVMSALLTLTGHYGGTLTHGATYLAEFAPAPIRAVLGLPEELAPRPPVKDVASADIYLDVVAPAFRARCVSCHNDDKRRGGLSLARYDAIVKGGDTGRVIKPGEADKSDLVRRVSLSEGEADFMPKNGKTPLTAEQVAIIKWWISQGAPRQGALGDLKAPDDIRKAVATDLGLSSDSARQATRPDGQQSDKPGKS